MHIVQVFLGSEMITGHTMDTIVAATVQSLRVPGDSALHRI